MQTRGLDDVYVRDRGVLVEAIGVQCVVGMRRVGGALSVHGVLRHDCVPGIVVIVIIVFVDIVDGVHRAAVGLVCAYEAVFGRDGVGVHGHSAEGLVSTMKSTKSIKIKHVRIQKNRKV